MGIPKLEENNKALLTKWFWRYHTEQHALWRKVVDAVHGSDRKWGALPINNNVTGVWKNLVAMCNNLKVDGLGVTNMIRGKVGNGRDIRFWIDPWICQEALKNRFPNLFALDKYKCCKVAERVSSMGETVTVCWSWKKAPGSTAELAERAELEGLLNDCALTSGKDRWVWNDNKCIVFTVAGVKRWLKEPSSNVEPFDFKWCKWLPSKCNIFMWRAFLDRLPTKLALRKRNVQVEDSVCVLCGDNDETTEHVFTGCGFAAGVWNGISVWCRMPQIYAFSVKDLVNIFEQCGYSEIKKKVIQGVIIITSWRLRKARNERIFTNKVSKVADIVSEVKVLGFLWYKNRAKGGTVDWEKWCKFDIM